MMLMECLVKCPWCLSETRLVVERANPVIYHCMGCDRNVVIHGSVIYTVSDEYVKKLLSSHKTKSCGKVLASQVSEIAREMEDSAKISALQNLLNQNIDVADFIKKLP